MSSRLAPQDVLAHPVRRHVLTIVEREPGVSLLVLLDRVRTEPAFSKLAYASLWHHVRKLERFQFLASRRSGRCRRYYSGRIHADPSSLALLQSPSFLLVAQALVTSPGISQAALHRELRERATFTRQALAYFLGRFENQRLISVFRAPGSRRYAATQKLAQLVDGLAGGSASFAIPMAGPRLHGLFPVSDATEVAAPASMI